MKANPGESLIRKEDLLFWHGLMLLWFKDLMNVTEKLQGTINQQYYIASTRLGMSGKKEQVLANLIWIQSFRSKW